MKLSLEFGETVYCAILRSPNPDLGKRELIQETHVLLVSAPAAMSPVAVKQHLALAFRPTTIELHRLGSICDIADVGAPACPACDSNTRS